MVRAVHAASIAEVGPPRLRVPFSGPLGATPAGASTRTLSFRAARAVPFPLTSRHRAAAGPPVSSEPGTPTRPRPVSRVPVKVTRCPDPGRLPSPGSLQQGVCRACSGCDPGCALGPRLPFIRWVGPPRGGSALRTSLTRSPRCLPRELLRPTSPDDFCSLSRPADRSANPDPCRHPADDLATTDRPRTGAHPAQREAAGR